MNNHPVSYNELLDFWSCNLESKRTSQVEEHLEKCQTCQTSIVRLNTLQSILRVDDSIEPPAHLVARAKTIYTKHQPVLHIPSPRPKLQLHSLGFSFAGGFAVVLILFLGLGFLIADQDVPSTSTFYPIVVTVKGLKILASNTRQVPQAPAPQVTSAPQTIAITPAQISVTSPDLVISQIYGGGGNIGATYTHDFIELFNRGAITASLAGWSLQYASATGSGNFGSTAANITELPDVWLAPGQYFLIQEARGSGGTTALPAPDFIDPTPIALSATDGKIALVNTTTPLGCNGFAVPCPSERLADVVDFIGYGKTDYHRGAEPAPAGSNTNAILRMKDGCMDTDNNIADFAVGVPHPRNTSSPRNVCAKP